jgi:hypothetical protein
LDASLRAESIGFPGGHPVQTHNIPEKEGEKQYDSSKYEHHDGEI